MFRAIALLSLVSIFVSSARGDTGRRPLLPQPQQIQYGEGQISLHKLVIEFSSTPNADDRFAASQLSNLIEERTGVRIPIAQTHRSGAAIVLDRTGNASPIPLPGERPGPQSREAYDLAVTPSGVTIRARSSAGLFYGVETLAQLVEETGQQAFVPSVTIHDWPSLAYRGTMMDMSHGPLLTEGEIKRQLDFLARWKDNQYYLYSEASIELKGYPLLNPRGQLSREEVSRIIAYGRERHIDVVPFFDLYGHMHDLFRIEKYSRLSDLPHGTEFDPSNPEVLSLLTDWISQFSQLFPSPFVSIGFDETFQAEMAARSREGGGPTPNQLFIKQIKDVTHLFQQHGKQVMAFSDIISLHPEMIPELPPGLIAIAWHFTSEDKNYTHQLEPLVASHMPHFVQPGLMNWAQVAPDYSTTFDNIDTFLAAGRKSNALGMINSVWSDDAQILYRTCFPGIAYGAAAAWQSQPMDRAHFFSNYAQITYSDSIAPEVAAALVDLDKSETSLQRVLGQQTMLAFWEDPFLPAHFKTLAGHQSDLRQTRLLAEDAEILLMRAISQKADSSGLNALLVVSRMLDYAGERFQTPLDLVDLWGRLGPRRPDANRWWNEWGSMVTYPDHSRLVDLTDAICELRQSYRTEWLAEYSPYRLKPTLGKWDSEYQYWYDVQKKLEAFSDSSKEGDVLPPLDEVIESIKDR